MADTGARANVGVSKISVKGRVPRLNLMSGRTRALLADVDKLEKRMQSRDIGNGAYHDAAQSLIDIAKAAAGAGNESFLGILAAQQAAAHLDKALAHAKKSQEAPKEALKASKKTLKEIEEAKMWVEVQVDLLGAGEADAEPQVVQKGEHQEEEMDSGASTASTTGDEA